MYFAYCPDDGFETFATAEEAKKCAEGHLDHYRDDAASDGWSEQVEQICWGEIKEEVRLISRKPVSQLQKRHFDEIWHYEMRSIHSENPVIDLDQDEDDEDDE